MTNDRLMTLLFALPRHNEHWFDPAGHDAKIAAVAANFTPDEIRAGIAEAEASIKRNDGIEFDDARARNKAHATATMLRTALALAGGGA